MADEEVRIEMTKGYDETDYCNEFGITSTQEAEEALENFDATYQQYMDNSQGMGGVKTHFVSWLKVP